MSFLTLDFSQSYPMFAAVLFLLTGLYLMVAEAKAYHHRGFVRESRWSKTLGWINVGLGICLFIALWLHHRMLWL